MAGTPEIEWSPNPTNSHQWPLLLPFLGHLQPQIARLLHNPPPRIVAHTEEESPGRQSRGPPPGFNAAHGRPLGHPWKNCGLTVGATVEAGKSPRGRPGTTSSTTSSTTNSSTNSSTTTSFTTTTSSTTHLLLPITLATATAKTSTLGLFKQSKEVGFTEAITQNSKFNF